MALFFSKLVSYTFLFWLPYYVTNNRMYLQRDDVLNSRCLNFKLSTNGFSLGIGGECVGRQRADLLSTLFDIGGIAGQLLLSSVLYELILHMYYSS